PELAAALAVTACRTVHLHAVRCILAGEDAAPAPAQHPGRVRSALSAVDQLMAQTAVGAPSLTSPPTTAHGLASSRRRAEPALPRVAGSRGRATLDPR